MLRVRFIQQILEFNLLALRGLNVPCQLPDLDAVVGACLGLALSRFISGVIGIHGNR